MREFVITYQGVGVSLNAWYSGSHWSKRTKLKAKYSTIFGNLFLEAGMHKGPKMDKFELHLIYNSLMDLDNVVAMAKIAVDTMKGRYVKEDDKRFYRKLTIEPNEELKMNTYIFRIKEVDGK